jgi:hypothetical protein
MAHREGACGEDAKGKTTDAQIPEKIEEILDICLAVL